MLADEIGKNGYLAQLFGIAPGELVNEKLQNVG